MEIEVGKYLKKSDSNVSKARKKAKHKHIYTDGVIYANKQRNWKQPTALRVRYCELCGKVYDYYNFYNVTETEQGSLFRFLLDEEIARQYGHLPQFYADEDLWKIKYLPIEKEKEEDE